MVVQPRQERTAVTAHLVFGPAQSARRPDPRHRRPLQADIDRHAVDLGLAAAPAKPI